VNTLGAGGVVGVGDGDGDGDGDGLVVGEGDGDGPGPPVGGTPCVVGRGDVGSPRMLSLGASIAPTHAAAPSHALAPSANTAASRARRARVRATSSERRGPRAPETPASRSPVLIGRS
jgi:hypothetical protein